MFARLSARTVRPLAQQAKLLSAGRTALASQATLPELGYGYKDLEPYIDGQIMEIHHSKHHNTYVTNLNAAMTKLADAEAKGDVGAIVQLQGAIKFNGGGHINHSIFWKNLAPTFAGGGKLECGSLKDAIDSQFGSLDGLKEKLSAAAVGVQGSGWGWLAYDKVACKLAIATTANQDPLEPTTGMVPLLGIDVWEHAYYLQYKNVRPSYVKEIFNVINWKDVECRYEAAKK
eukprot:TRINITY_DN4754_c0_g1_i1.p1 TRINITY_DN4754_c0_g1~~TRINITY_DN4754_c0_g1_i1.p1  ORF type:complete len:231 (-),score=71.80 TRINITY_DN4754_c0_g1_i1:291-983(-)